MARVIRQNIRVLGSCGVDYLHWHEDCAPSHIKEALTNPSDPLLVVEVCEADKVSDTATCFECNGPVFPAPFQFHDTVEADPRFCGNYLKPGEHLLVTGVHWYHQWLIDGQRLDVDQASGHLTLTSVKRVMVPWWAAKLANSQWRGQKHV